MLAQRLKSNFDKCNGTTHAYNKIKLQKGLQHVKQTHFLAQQIAWQNVKTMDQMIQLPNKHF